MLDKTIWLGRNCSLIGVDIALNTKILLRMLRNNVTQM